MGPRTRVADLVLQRPPVLARHLGVHRHRLAVGVGPAAAVWVLRIEVRISRQVLPPAGKDQLAKDHALQSLGSQVGLEDFILVRLEVSDRPAADQFRPFRLVAAPQDRGCGRTGILGVQLQRLGQRVLAGPHVNSQRLGQLAPRLDSPDLVASPLQRGKRPVGLRRIGFRGLARPGILAFGRHVQVGGCSRQRTRRGDEKNEKQRSHGGLRGSKADSWHPSSSQVLKSGQWMDIDRCDPSACRGGGVLGDELPR